MVERVGHTKDCRAICREGSRSYLPMLCRGCPISSEFLIAACMGGDLRSFLGLLPKGIARTTNSRMKDGRYRVAQLAPEDNPVAEAVAEDGDD